MKMLNYTALQQSSTAGLRRDSEFQTVGPAEEKAWEPNVLWGTVSYI